MSTVELTVATPSVGADIRPIARLQRRTIATLIATQVTGGLGLAAAVTVGSLIAADLGGAAAAGLPLTAAVAGTAATAYPLSLIMRRAGRRRGLRLGWFTGAAGALVAVSAVSHGSLPLLIAGMVLFGGAEAASSAARFAAADLAPLARRGIAIGTVVCSTAVTATVGPVLVGPVTSASAAAGMAPLAGPFALSALAFVVAGTVLTVALRPDPLLIAAGVTATDESRTTAGTAAQRLTALFERPGVRLGVSAVVVANFTMLALMTVTPLHIAAGHVGGGHHGVELIGVVISVHIAGMFAPAPLTGRLGDRFGHQRVVVAGAVLLATAGMLVVGADATRATRLIVALLLLGVGWNLAFVGGSSLITNALDARERPRVQGLADTAMGLAGMLGAALSGLVMARTGFGGVALLCTAVAVALAVAATRRIIGAAGPDTLPDRA